MMMMTMKIAEKTILNPQCSSEGKNSLIKQKCTEELILGTPAGLSK